jgi:hypothetical protein
VLEIDADADQVCGFTADRKDEIAHLYPSDLAIVGADNADCK